MKKLFRRKKIDPVALSSLLVCLCILLLTIGFSVPQASLNIRNMGALVRIVKEIRITGIRATNPANNATESSTDYNVHNVYGNISLPNNNSTVTYTIEITNIGNADMGIREITGLPSNLTYTISDYNIGATLCDAINTSQCNLGSVSVINLTVGYAENGYDGINTDFAINLDFDFYEITYVARIGSNYYQTLQDAVTAVPSNHTETTVVLLKNTAERVTINPGKDVVLDLQGLMISNPDNNTPVIEIFGVKRNGNEVITAQGGASLRISNGTISSNASQGAINVEEGGTLTMTGGTVNATGARQALYVNKGGTATISGTAYLSARAVAETGNQRGTVQAVAGATLVKAGVYVPPGNLTITGGTIEANSATGVAVSCYGIITLGTEDGNISTTVPEMRGNGAGIYINSSGTLNFYDGIAKGGTIAIINESDVADIETGYSIAHSSEIINNATYDTALLGQGALVTFNPNQGTVDEPSRNVLVNSAVGNLPVPTRTGFVFDGWFTENDVEVTSSTVITEAITFYAHWISEEDYYVALIGNTKYETLAAAIASVTGSTPTTITVVKNIIENISIPSGRNITLDLQNYTLSLPANAATTTPTIENKGTLTITSGTITTYSEKTAAINNKSKAVLYITGGNIISTGDRQALYNDGGTATISGTAHLTAKALVETSNKRGTVQNLNSGVLIITGGTIESTGANGIGVTNVATATIGVDDGVVSTTSPSITGLGIGINNTKTLKFYDGVIRGQTSAISGTVTSWDSNSTITVSQETIDGITYEVKTLN